MSQSKPAKIETRFSLRRETVMVLTVKTRIKAGQACSGCRQTKGGGETGQSVTIKPE